MQVLLPAQAFAIAAPSSIYFLSLETSVIHRHYDVVVLGRSIAALTVAALLARRDFTVLLAGQGERPANYSVEGRSLRRRSATMLAANSPAWARVIVELAQSQTWKRRVSAASPMLQILAPRSRLDVHPDLALFVREVDREFPEIHRLIDELYAELARLNASADEVFEKDAVWPPGTFWERRETGRHAAMLPYIRAEPDADLLVDFPRGHLFRQIVSSSVLFGTALSTLPPPFAVARLHGAWTRGLFVLPGGEDELEEFMVERIEAHGGRVLRNGRAASLQVKRGVATGVLLDGEEHVTGADFVISDGEGEMIAALSGGEGIHKRAQREWPRITSSVGRFVACLVVKKSGLPAPLGPEVLILPGDRQHRGLFRIPRAVHLQRCELAGFPDEILLVAEMLLPDSGPLSLTDAREAIVAAIAAELPFVEEHLVLVDSVHDGLPVWIYQNGKRRLLDRLHVKGALNGAEPMVRQIEVDPPGYLGLAGEPIRGPIEHTLLVGRSVLPGLGQEGQLLAAWGAARLITRTDRKKERMRRDMWSKVEIG